MPKEVKKEVETEFVDSYEELNFVELKEDADERKLDRKGVRSKKALIVLLEADDAKADGSGESEGSGKGKSEIPSRLVREMNDAGRGSDTLPKVIKQGKGDYLRKYQCKKITVDGKTWHAIGGERTDPDKGSRAERMKAGLLKQIKISTIIYPEPGSNVGIPFTVNLNGYRLDLPRNTYIEIPEQIANVVRKSQQQKIDAVEKEPTRIDPENESSALKG